MSPVIISDVVQGTPEWMALRIGVPGASSFDQIITTTGAASAQRNKLLYKLAGERLLGAKEESYSNAAMQRGIELEPVARSVFSMLYEIEVTEVGFVYFDERRDRGCSPDGLIDNSSGLEIKCPSLPVHIEYLLSGKLPTAYYFQVHGSMLMTGRDSWHFFSYYPSLTPLHLVIQRDDKICNKLHDALESFCGELAEITEKLKGMS